MAAGGRDVNGIQNRTKDVTRHEGGVFSKCWAFGVGLESANIWAVLNNSGHLGGGPKVLRS